MDKRRIFTRFNHYSSLKLSFYYEVTEKERIGIPSEIHQPFSGFPLFIGQLVPIRDEYFYTFHALSID